MLEMTTDYKANGFLRANLRVAMAIYAMFLADEKARAMEIEADLLSMRILAAAGFDPRVVMRVLGDGGVCHRADTKEGEEARQVIKQVDAKDERAEMERYVLYQTHLMSEDRYSTIKKELDLWQQKAEGVPLESEIT